MKERVDGSPPGGVSRAPLPSPGCEFWEHQFCKVFVLLALVNFSETKREGPSSETPHASNSFDAWFQPDWQL
jgi:hypothetical protein